MAISTLNKLLGAQYLRRGDGILKLRDSRRKERLFGGSGRSSGERGLKHENRGAEYLPSAKAQGRYTCIKAFIRLLAVNACTDGNTV